jgi:outer membrane protein TolC
MKIYGYFKANYKFGFFCCSLFLISTIATAQKRILSIADVIALVQSGQPQLQGYQEQTKASRYGIDLAKNTLVPNLTAGYQAGYATYNNITGMSYPGLIMPITGPTSSNNNYNPVPGTALTALIQWTPFTFGQRQAAIEKAVAQFKMAGSYYDNALFQQKYAVIAIYLNLIYFQKMLISQRLNIERTGIGLQQSLSLAKQGLRPGIDTVQFQAALAQADMDRLNTQRLYQSQILELYSLTGLSGTPDDLILTDSLLTAHLPLITDTTGIYTQNPDYKYYQAQVAVSTANLKEVERGWRPRLDIWANAYARGSGVEADGTVDKANGWALSRNNYGAGVQLSFPILQFQKVNIQKRQYHSLLKADQAQLSQVSINLQRQIETAEFNYRQNLLIAGQAPVQLKAMLYAYDGLKLSYQSGLIDFTSLIQGQYQLLNAETMQANAYLQVWKSLLDIAVSKGNLNLFTDLLK